jgi:hypothetical protein
MTDARQGAGPVRLLAVALFEFAVCLFIAAHWLPGGLELVIRPVGAKEPLFVLPLEPGERFTLSYIHSVDNSPVWEEHFSDEFGNIYVDEERFVSMGAGMGHWEGHGILAQRGPYQVIENIDERIGDFVVRVGHEDTRQTIVWRGNPLDLSKLVPGQAVIVSVVPISRLMRLWRRVFPHPSSALLEEQ